MNDVEHDLRFGKKDAELMMFLSQKRGIENPRFALVMDDCGETHMFLANDLSLRESLTHSGSSNGSETNAPVETRVAMTSPGRAAETARMAGSGSCVATRWDRCCIYYRCTDNGHTYETKCCWC
jgi:hypothetical protein